MELVRLPEKARKFRGSYLPQALPLQFVKQPLLHKRLHLAPEEPRLEEHLPLELLDEEHGG